MKILVVEDNRWLQVLYQNELAEEGYEVFVAGSGAKALEQFESVKPDLVTIDLGLPDAEGASILAEMKEKFPEVPVIILTAYDRIDEEAKSLADASLMKSSDLSSMREEIARLLSEPRPKRKALRRASNLV